MSSSAPGTMVSWARPAGSTSEFAPWSLRTLVMLMASEARLTHSQEEQLIPTLERNARISLRGQVKTSSTSAPTKILNWQRRAASLHAPLSGSPRRNLKPVSLTPRHPLTTDSSSEGLPAPKLYSRVGKRPKLDINSAASPV
ncbi:hypothetical protein MHYP_G00294400 [Metynnis hypsauchen]